METVSEFRGSMMVGGTVRVVNHLFPALSGIRVVLKAQSGGWYLSSAPARSGTTNQGRSPCCAS